MFNLTSSRTSPLTTTIFPELLSEAARILTAVAVILFTGVSCTQDNTAAPEIHHIESDSQTGTSLANFTENVPLVFTNQVFPVDGDGNLIGESDLESQLDRTLSNLTTILRAAGTDLTSLLRINFYLSDNSNAAEVLRLLGDRLPDGARPAATLVSGKPARAGALVSIDAVAAVRNDGTGRVKLFRVPEIYAPDQRSHAAVLPANRRKVFVAGQSAGDETLVDATQSAMRGLLATLAYSDATAADIVQVKAFIQPVEDAEAVEEEITSFFRGGPVPPIVTVEWLHDSRPTEIELIASGTPEPEREEASSYYAPPWMSQATTFSRIVDVHSGGLFFTSGLYGEAGQDANAQARAIYETLGTILEKTGSDYDHLVKATYYPSTDEGAQGLRDVRTSYYNPERPPAASLIKVAGTGREGTTLNVDMIGVIP